MTRVPWPLVLPLVHSTLVCLVIAGFTTLSGCATGGFSSPLHGLSAHLEDARLGNNDTIEVDFVLTNHGDSDIVLASQGSEFGAYQWTFQVRDALGRVYDLGNRQRSWRASGFWPFTIEPGETAVKRCRLDPSSARNTSEDGFRVFSLVGEPLETHDLAFPLSVTGYFIGFEDNLARGANWSGTIWTEAVVVPSPVEVDPDQAYPIHHYTYRAPRCRAPRLPVSWCRQSGQLHQKSFRTKTLLVVTSLDRQFQTHHLHPVS